MLAHVALVLAFGLQTAPVEIDTDGDGLSDFHEVHKHRTDPKRADSDGDGIADGGWDERREYAYTVRTIVRVVPPVDVGEPHDYQDARVLARGEDWVELEVVHYPLGTAHQAIGASPAWRDGTGAVARFTDPTTTSRFDAAMRAELVAELAARGIDADVADDRTLAVETAQYLLQRARPEDGFSTFVADFDGERAVVPRELEVKVQARELEYGRTIREQWDRELFADGMFRHRTRGTCTSTAIYLAGGLRAVGLPTRIVLSIPVADANDPEQIAMVERGIRHHRVRETALEGLSRLAGSWSSHTFDEVFVGGHWQRLDGDRLGVPILDERRMGLMTHVLTVRDWADARMGTTVGRRQELGLRDDVFRTANPYATLLVEDSFGEHARVANPPVEAVPALEVLELVEAHWVASKERPRYFEVTGVDPENDRHHVLLGARITHEEFDTERLQTFWRAVPKELRLVADGDEPLPAQIVRGWWRGVNDGKPYLHFIAQIAPDVRDRMRAGVRYAIVPAARTAGPRFTAEKLTITPPR